MDFEIGEFKIEAMDMPTAMVTLAERYARLLAVARAARTHLDTNGDDEGEMLAAALAAVEDLL